MIYASGDFNATGGGNYRIVFMFVEGSVQRFGKDDPLVRTLVANCTRLFQ
jgi:hypothetical protein